MTIDERILERCARLFMLNTIDALEILRCTATEIINRILSDPTEVKYRMLKVANKTVRAKLLDISGGSEFLQAIGFRPASIEGISVLQLVDDLPLDAVRGLLTAAIDWLNHTTELCRSFAAVGLSTDSGKRSSTVGNNISSNSNTGVVVSDTLCCECIINLRLPTGSVVSGGFMRGDLVEDVLAFASSYFQLDRADGVKLIDPVTSKELQGDDFSRSIHDMWGTPRLTILATLKSRTEREQSLKAANTTVMVRDLERERRIANERQAKLKEREKLQQERMRTLEAFKEDRLKNAITQALIEHRADDIKPNAAAVTTADNEDADYFAESQKGQRRIGPP